jgi:hypothetical protein
MHAINKKECVNDQNVIKADHIYIEKQHNIYLDTMIFSILNETIEMNIIDLNSE